MSWNTYLDSHQDRFVDALADFIAIPSVSAQDAHFEDVVRAGNWVIDRLHDAGIANARMMEIETHPQ